MSQENSQNDNLYLWDKDINLRVLYEYLVNMHKANLKLDDEAIENLKKSGINNPIDLANFCFKSGWDEAVKVLLQGIAQREIGKDGNCQDKIQ